MALYPFLIKQQAAWRAYVIFPFCLFLFLYLNIFNIDQRESTSCFKKISLAARYSMLLCSVTSHNICISIRYWLLLCYIYFYLLSLATLHRLKMCMFYLRPSYHFNYHQAAENQLGIILEHLVTHYPRSPPSTTRLTPPISALAPVLLASSKSRTIPATMTFRSFASVFANISPTAAVQTDGLDTRATRRV